MNINQEIEIGSLGISLKDLYNIIENLTNFSTTEKRIGKWINGKPIYRKVITYTSTHNGWQQFNHNISNIDAIINISGYILTSEGWFRPLPSSETADNPTAYSASIEYATKNLITFIRGNQSSGNMNLYVVLEYTKTTD